MTETITEDQLREALQNHFGYPAFRPLQQDVIQNTLSGGDGIVLMPTGGGKSICYQLPAILLEGLTVVVSPLIALMKDQVESLRSNGVSAAYLNSSLDAMEAREVEDALENGQLKLLYVSPERVFANGFLSWLEKLNVSLFAIDEAHCVSSWGHHFRPEYQRLHVFKDQFPEIPVLALTATADKAVRSDMGELLGMNSPEMYVASFDRPNLSIAVLPGRKKWEQLLPLVRRYPGQSGIVYCQSRNGTEQLAEKLRGQGFTAKAYHAGLDSEVRGKVQDEFIQGECPIVCATIAFGMGIDKADVRFVVHYNMPSNLESYYQEIGRAGRDGEPSETVLFYSYRDVQTQLGFLDEVENQQYRDIQEAKLKRMQQFAEAQVCRRKILLSYFSEMPGEDCGNCDVCKNPPTYFDGTVNAQMALSAVARVKEKAGITTLIDILKGAYSVSVREGGFDRIKTFGAGRNTTAFAWQLFVQQLIQQGYLELDYKDGYTLKLTPLSKEVLFDDRQVQMVTPETIKERQEEQKKVKVAKPKKAAAGPVNESLFEHLRTLRAQIAGKMGKPAYVVFSNASLEDMAAKTPTNRDEFLDVHGVGDHKAKQYGETFLSAIAEFQATGGK